jgi:hypothetical protein
LDRRLRVAFETRAASRLPTPYTGRDTFGKEAFAVTGVLSPTVSLALALPWARLAAIWKERLFCWWRERTFCCPPKAKVASVAATATLAWNARRARRNVGGKRGTGLFYFRSFTSGAFFIARSVLSLQRHSFSSGAFVAIQCINERARKNIERIERAK